MTTYIVLFDDVHGRRTHGVTRTPVEMLAERINDGQMSTAQLSGVKVMELSSTCDVDAEVKDLATRLRQAENARMNPEVLRKQIKKNKVTPEEVEAIRQLLQRRHPDENYDSPWPESVR